MNNQQGATSPTAPGERKIHMKFRRKLMVVMAAAAFAALGVTLVPGAKVEAATVYNSGQPGSVAASRAYGYATPGQLSPSISFDLTKAWRSSSYSAYKHVICADFRVFRKSSPSGDWAFAFNNNRCVTTSPGQYAQFPLFTRAVDPYFYYTADVAFTWKLTNGTVIGRKTLAYAQTSDYQCLPLDSYTTCSVVWDSRSARAAMWLSS